MNNFTNNLGEKITVGLGYRFIGQYKKDAHFTLIDIDPKKHQATLLALKSKKAFWVDIDSLMFMRTDGNKQKSKKLIGDDGSYLKSLIGKQNYQKWLERSEATA